MKLFGVVAWTCLAVAIARGQTTDLGLAPPDDSTPTFGTSVILPAGLRGEIFYLKPGADQLPRFEKMEPVGAIYTTQLNIPPREFKEGFPGVTDRFEWFAIDYTGRFYISDPGKYRFALVSDDGSKLYIDGHTVINNDGSHPARFLDGTVNLAGGIHSIRVSYFQGPRFQIALILAVSRPGGAWRVFSTNEFKPPANPADWKYGDPNQLPPDPNAGRRKLGDTTKK